MGKKSRISTICVFVFIVFMCVFLIRVQHYLNKYFGNVTANEILFFLQTPMKGVDTNLLSLFIHKCIFLPFMYTALICLFPYLYYLLVQAVRYCCKKNLDAPLGYASLLMKIYVTTVIVLSVISIISNLSKFKFIYDIYSSSDMSYSTFYEEHFNMPNAENVVLNEKKNLIILHVESMEKTFENKSFFNSSLIPHLQKLEKEGVQFTSYINGYGTDYTAGSLIAIFTGIPVNVFSNNFLNYFGKKMEFKSNIYSLGRILKNNGYSNIALLGTDAEFAGQGSFLLANGCDNLIDKQVIKEKHPNLIEESWGYDDQTVLNIAKEIIAERKSSVPYFLFIQTADTHTGYVAKEKKFDKFANPYFNQIYNTSAVIEDFVEWLKVNSDYKNTVIVIVGDHLRMGENITMPENREIFNLFLNTPKPKCTNRLFSQIDLFPTILEAMKGEVKDHHLGLGISVFSDKPTLAEQFDRRYLNEQLARPSRLSEKIWK